MSLPAKQRAPFAWMVVAQASPLRVRARGETGLGVEAVAPAGVSLAIKQRVLVATVGTETVVVGGYAVPAGPIPQDVYLSSPDGSVFKLTVSNSGTLGATKQ